VNSQQQAAQQQGPRRERSPERSRDLFTAIENGTRLGRLHRDAGNHQDGQEGRHA